MKQNISFEITYVANGSKQTIVVIAQDKLQALEAAKNKISGNILKIQEVKNNFVFLSYVENINEMFIKRKASVDLDVLIFTVRQISVMINAGIPFTDVLREAATSCSDKRLKEVLLTALADVNAGLSFSQSLEKNEDAGKLVTIMARLGEKTGAMAEAMDALALILEENARNKEKLKRALRYPIMTFISMIIAFVILIVFVVPKFKVVFEKFKADLPLPTKILLELEHIFTSYGLLIIVFSIIFYAIFKIYYAKNPKFEMWCDKAVLKIKIIGELIQYASMFRFMIVFSELAKAGLPIIEAVNIAAAGVDNRFLQSNLYTITLNIKRGLPLTVAFKESGVFESMIIQIISAGEASGTLSKMLAKSTDYYRARFQNKMDGLSASLEPILIFVMGCGVLILALGIFMPMWQLAGAVKG